MTLAYIIIAHKNPQQLGRLVGALHAESVAFFIHVDKKVAISPFLQAVAGQAPGADVTWVKRERARWGRLGIVLGTLNALRAIVARPGRYQRIILLSGLDYPLVPNAAIRAFFEAHPHTNFMEYFPLDATNTPDWMHRLHLYHFNLFGKYLAYPAPARSWKRKVMNLALAPVFPAARTFPGYVRPYGGSQWWCITDAAAREIVAFVDKHPDYVQYHVHTFIPDEIFFQTILLNSGNAEIMGNLRYDNLKFIDWSRPKPRPAVFTDQDFALLRNSGKLFARKFDVNKNSKILDLLDEQFRQESPAGKSG